MHLKIDRGLVPVAITGLLLSLMNTIALAADMYPDGNISHWANNLLISGVVEIETSHSDPFEGKSTADIALATMELSVETTNKNNLVHVAISVLHEDDDTEPWELDQSIINIGNTEKYPLTFSAGRMYLPFGNFTSNMISDPLTLEIAETREAAIQLGYETSGFYASVFLFNGDTSTNNESVEHYGASLGMILDSGLSSFEIGASYINNIADADEIQTYLQALLGDEIIIADNVAAWSGYSIFTVADFFFMVEYVSAIDEFSIAEIPYNNNGAKPASASLEIAYNFTGLGHDSTFAVAYQKTQQLLSLGMPERRVLVALSTAFDDSTVVSLEWAHDYDYSTGDSGVDDSGAPINGTGKSADTVTLQLAVAF